MNDIERRRPIKQFKVIKAHGPYRVGDVMQPTGMYRDVLLRRGLIEEVKEEAAPRTAQPELDRMVPSRAPIGGAGLLTRRRR